MFVSTVLEAVAAQENIAASDEELEARLEKLIAESGDQMEQAREAAKQDDVRDNVRQALVTEKTVDWLWSVSEVTEQELREYMAEQTAKRIADQAAAQKEVEEAEANAESEAAPEA